VYLLPILDIHVLIIVILILFFLFL
jgi:hypothetical protein